MQAIETSYAGCRFRSRLEARWAVFFDTLDIRWEYEAQGYMCSPRCWLTGNSYDAKFPYLPDFWLPEYSLFAEIKGTLDQPGLYRLLDAAAYLSSPGGGCGGGEGDMLVLGPVPQGPYFPVRLHMHKGDLEATPWLLENGKLESRASYVTVADDGSGVGTVRSDWKRTADVLLHGWPLGNWANTACPSFPDFLGMIKGAYAAARSARFEFGESGATAAARVTAARFPTLYQLSDETHEAGCLKSIGYWYVRSDACPLAHE